MYSGISSEVPNISNFSSFAGSTLSKCSCVQHGPLHLIFMYLLRSQRGLYQSLSFLPYGYHIIPSRVNVPTPESFMPVPDSTAFNIPIMSVALNLDPQLYSKTGDPHLFPGDIRTFSLVMFCVHSWKKIPFSCSATEAVDHS